MILYLHGFSSGAKSEKATQLRALLAPTEVRVPAYPAHDPRHAIEQLLARARECFPHGGARLIGSSLGGYYAQYLAARDRRARAVLINPALEPLRQLRPALGHNTNHVTGEPFEFTPVQLAALGDYDAPAESLAGRVLVLLDRDDDVIPYQHAADKYREHGAVYVYPGGSHRFDHLEEALPRIRRFLAG